MILLLAVLLILYPVVSPAATVLSEKDIIQLKKVARGKGTTFPTAPSTNDTFLLTSDSAVGDCNESGGTAVTLCRYNGSSWIALSSASSPSGLGANFDVSGGELIDDATETKPLKIRGTGGMSTTGWNIYTHSSNGPTIKCVVSNVEGDCDIDVSIDSGNKWSVKDSSGNVIIQIVPGASGMGNKYVFGSSYRPLKSIFIPASYMSTDGTNCVAPAEVTPVASGAKLYTILCADNDSSRMHFHLIMPDSWDGGTVTLTHAVVQTAADTNVIEFQAAGQCKGDTESLVATSSYGTEVVWTDTMSGSGKVNLGTSGAITPSGTCAASDWVSFYVDIGATNTTTAMATAHILGFKMEYAVTSLSD